MMKSTPFGRDLERDGSPRDRRCALLAIALVTEAQFLQSSHTLLGDYPLALRLAKWRVKQTWRVSFSLEKRMLAPFGPKWGHDTKSSLQLIAWWVKGNIVTASELSTTEAIVESVCEDYRLRRRLTK